jgi:hypothetical protein
MCSLAMLLLVFLSEGEQAVSHNYAKAKWKERQFCIFDSLGGLYFTDIHNVTLPSYAEFYLIQIS